MKFICGLRARKEYRRSTCEFLFYSLEELADHINDEVFHPHQGKVFKGPESKSKIRDEGNLEEDPEM